MTYEEKLEMANNILKAKIGQGWNELEDSNSLHDIEPDDGQAWYDAIYDACNDRFYNDAGFNFSDLDEMAS